MSIRNKILLYFSLVAVLLNGITFYFIYNRFELYREEEFQQRQKEKIISTIKYLTQIKHIEEHLLESMDRLNIEDIFDEKLLIFDSDKKLIYSSIDNTPINFSKEMLQNLTRANDWVERKDGRYDVIGIVVQNGSNEYYAISKAYDHFGYSKLDYLRNVLLFSFLIISIIIITLSWFLSGRITNTIVRLTEFMRSIDFNKKYEPLPVPETQDEVELLTRRFNELMTKMNEAFSFQKHAVHHISHELKTPIAILVSNFDRIEQESDNNKLRELVMQQKEGTRNLSEIINALLEIAKVESGTLQSTERVRIDELIFDIMDELQLIHPHFVFKIDYGDENISDYMLTINGNKRLLRSVFQNLMMNCIHYSDNPIAYIDLLNQEGCLEIIMRNSGTVITDREKSFMFQHFFRGSNSKGKRGFGLGLVLINKILQLHHGSIQYKSQNGNENIFIIRLPLS